MSDHLSPASAPVVSGAWRATIGAGAREESRETAVPKVLTRLVRRLADGDRVRDVLHDFTVDAAEALDVVGAGLALVEHGRITGAAVSSDAVASLERAQQDSQDGPSVETCRSGQVTLVDSLRSDPGRWPALGRAAAEASIAAIAAIPVRAGGATLGSLDLYHRADHEWSEHEVAGARPLADMAGAVLANGARLDHFEHTIDQLQRALDSRVVIEQAKGMLAAQRDVSVDEAFRLLRAHARTHNVSLRAVAEAVVKLHLDL